VREWLQHHGLTIAGYWLAALAIIIMSVVYYQYVERPLHSGFRRLLGVGKKAQVPDSLAKK
jgi:peptidoglycan/LPS O-acetylase OafA/YrhL